MHGDTRGQALIEYALTLPMLVFALLGGADLARAYAIQLAVQNGTRAGAEAAAIDFSPTQTETIARTRDEMDRTPGMNAANAIVSVTLKQTDGTTDCVDPPTPITPCYVTVRAQYTFRTITPWPIIPNTAGFDRATTMRTIKGGAIQP
ncbi:MAG: pilus assembly protein [Chloroflexi bacterium]|nr:pilus assembly protein [Chloroflexota bacterium]